MDQMTNGSTCGCNGAKNCVCKHHKVVPMAILVAGIAFVLQGLGVLEGISFTLVFGALLVVVGWMKMMKGKCKCC